MDVVTAWSHLATPRVEIGIGDSHSPTVVGEWNRSHWGSTDDALWSGVEPLWIDVTEHFRRIELVGGVDYTVGRFGVGQCQLVGENRSGWATLLRDNATDLRVRRSVRVTGQIQSGVLAGTSFPLYRGYIDSIVPTYLADGQPGVQLDCVDALSLFADDDPLELTSPVGAHELSGARVARILDRTGWPKSWRDIDPGQVTLQGTTLARNYADELGVTADSEGGSLFMSPEGWVIYRDRDWWRTSYTGPVFTIGNGPAADVCPSSWTAAQAMNDVVSQVALANAGGTARSYVAADTFAKVGPSTFRRFDLVADSDAQLDVLGARILAVRGSLSGRVQGATLTMLGEANRGRNLADELFTFLRYGVRCRAFYIDPATGTTDFDLPMIVTRIAHAIEAEGDWTTTLGLEDAGPYQPAEPWGVARWGAGTWASAT
ncbi:MAG TPA: hypothetical protein VGM93_09095 [Acidimicrobiales bacterium]